MNDRTVPEITELNLPHARGYLTIEDDGENVKAIIRPTLSGATATDHLHWLRDAVVAAGEYLGTLCDKGQEPKQVDGVTVVAREIASYEAFLTGRITKAQYLATDPRDVVLSRRQTAPPVPTLPPWRVELERLRKWIAGHEANPNPPQHQRNDAPGVVAMLVKLEFVEALRGLKKLGAPVSLPQWMLDTSADFSHFSPATFRIDETEGGNWVARVPSQYNADNSCMQVIKPTELDDLIDAAGAAVLAGEG